MQHPPNSAPTNKTNKSAQAARPKVSPAREVALAMLLRVEKQDSFASDLLHGNLSGRLDSRDMGLCTELVLGCLRWKSQLDFAVQQFTSGKWNKFDAEVQIALRLGAYQLLHLTRVPARAAIAESVELARSAGKSSATGLVNAVLRRVSEIGGSQQLARLRPAAMSDLEWDAVEVAHPAWLLQRWQARWGRAQASARAAGNNQPPVTYVRKTSLGDCAALIQQFQFEDVVAAPSSILKNCLTISQGDITRTEAYLHGEIVIQDQASQLVPLLLDVRPGHLVLDLCAAPGNKTSLLALAAGPTGMVVASDVHLHRLRQGFIPPASEQAAPLHRLVMDGSAALPLRGPFDRVLVDAPCSGTGTLRRNPEIKWRLRPESLRELSQLQLKLLRQAATVVGTGGRIGYSTCSMEPEENQNVVESFLAEHPEFTLVPMHQEAARLAGHLTDPSSALNKELFAGTFLETSPDQHQTDGFFAAILERRPK